jgi:hypothetical protein
MVATGGLSGVAGAATAEVSAGTTIAKGLTQKAGSALTSKAVKNVAFNASTQASGVRGAQASTIAATQPSTFQTVMSGIGTAVSSATQFFNNPSDSPQATQPQQPLETLTTNVGNYMTQPSTSNGGQGPPYTNQVWSGGQETSQISNQSVVATLQAQQAKNKAQAQQLRNQALLFDQLAAQFKGTPFEKKYKDLSLHNKKEADQLDPIGHLELQMAQTNKQSINPKSKKVSAYQYVY